MSKLLAPVKPAAKSFEELVAVVKEHVAPKPLVIAERFRFHQRNQGEGETVAQYIAELRKLADKCKLSDYLEQALRDRLVCGLRQESIQWKLLTLVEPVMLQKVYETAQGMAVAQARAVALQASARASTASVATGPSIQVVRQKKQTEPPRQRSADLNCYRCGKPGHSPDRCYYKNQWCRNCGKRGHIAKVCGLKVTHYVAEEPSPEPEIKRSLPNKLTLTNTCLRGQ